MIATLRTLGAMLSPVRAAAEPVALSEITQGEKLKNVASYASGRPTVLLVTHDDGKWSKHGRPVG